MYQAGTDANTGYQFIYNTVTKQYIPLAAGNKDYEAYLAWVAEGNTATAYTGS